MSKQDAISSIYYDPAGYSSIQNTYRDAKQKDRSITIQDVKTFFKQKVVQKTTYSGQNSYVAKKLNPSITV